MAIKNVIFDLGGVLVDWDPRYVYEKKFDTKEAMEDFLHNITTEEWNLQQDAGRTLAEATKVLTEQHPEHKALIESFYGEWEDMLKGDIPENVALLEPLKKHYSMYALTNWSFETWPVAQRRFPFLNIFEGIVVSGIEKMIKPNNEIYALISERYNLLPEESLFIDDNIKNINAAEALGFHIIHCKNINLREELIKKGIRLD